MASSAAAQNSSTTNAVAAKILLSGDVGGRFEKLAKRVTKLHSSKHGPFDAVFACGRFFSAAVPDDASVAGAREALSKCPVPIYLTSSGDKSERAWVEKVLGSGTSSESGGAAVAASPHRWLGDSGVTTVSGLKVAFCSSSAMAGSLAKRFVAGEFRDGVVDLLLTPKWGAGWDTVAAAMGSPLPVFGGGPNPHEHRGSGAVAELVVAAAPRYHFAAGAGRFLQLAPYCNYSKAGAFRGTTRFVGLASVAPAPGAASASAAAEDLKKRGKKGAKWLHALNLTAGGAVVGGPPAGATACPYAGAPRGSMPVTALPPPPITSRPPPNRPGVGQKRSAAALGGMGGPGPLSSAAIAALEMEGRAMARSGAAAGNFIFGAGRGNKRRRRNNDRGGGRGGGRGGRDDGVKAEALGQLASCWFCLSTPTIEKQLIVSVGVEAYLALPKGPLHSLHVLLLPISHVACTLMLNRSALRELQKHKKAVREFFASLPATVAEASAREKEGAAAAAAASSSSSSSNATSSKKEGESRGVDNRPAWMTEVEKQEAGKEQEVEQNEEGKAETEKESAPPGTVAATAAAAAETTGNSSSSSSSSSGDDDQEGYGLLTIERHTATRGGLAQSHALIEMIPVPPVSSLPEKERKALRELCDSAENVPGQGEEEEEENGGEKDHVAAAFCAAGRKMNIAFDAIPGGTTLAQALGFDRDAAAATGVLPPQYLLVTTPAGTRLLHKVCHPRFPIQWARSVACRIVGRPDRRAWKNCVLPSKEAEQKSADSFRSQYKGFEVDG